MVRVQDLIYAPSREVRNIERVSAEEVVEESLCRVEVFLFLAQDVGVDEHHSLVRHGAVGTPVEVRIVDGKAVAVVGHVDIAVGKREN